MKHQAVLDVAIFIWNATDFEKQKHRYFLLMDSLPVVYEYLIEQKIPVVLRGQLQSEIYEYFPYMSIPSEYFDFQVSTLQFLANARFVQYNEDLDVGIFCDPELIKPFFKNSTRKEIQYLITHLYNDNQSNRGFLTFKLFWVGSTLLSIHNSHKIEIETYLCDDKNEHKKIFSNFKKIFEHNPKHNYYKSSETEYYGELVSSLSCYDERIADTTEAQKLLDKAVKFKSSFYAYDKNNRTYVRFVPTSDNKFHAFDVKLSEDDKIRLRKEYKEITWP